MFHVVDMTGNESDENAKQFHEALNKLDPMQSKHFFFFICMFIDMLNTGGHTAELRIGKNGFALYIDNVESGRFTPQDPVQPINALFIMLQKASELPHSPFLMQSLHMSNN